MRKEAADCLDGLGAAAQVEERLWGEWRGSAFHCHSLGFESVKSKSDEKRSLGKLVVKCTVLRVGPL